jgi:hypothetical protein
MKSTFVLVIVVLIMIVGSVGGAVGSFPQGGVMLGLLNGKTEKFLLMW